MFGRSNKKAGGSYTRIPGQLPMVNLALPGLADALSSKVHMLRGTPGFEIPLFIENIVGRKEHLMSHGKHISVLIENRRIVIRLAAALIVRNSAEDHADAHGRFFYLFPVADAVLNKSPFVEQVSRRVANY